MQQPTLRPTDAKTHKALKPKAKRHSLDPHNVFKEGLYFAEGNEACVTIHPELADRPRLTLTVREAYEQGILTEQGVNPQWLAVIPVMSEPGWHLCATSVKRMKDGTFHTYNTQPNCDPLFRDVFPPIRLNPKARLHLVVNC